ncbi:MAG: GDP-mannose 4,6-dehydratase, partial [Bacteroidales bacterium]|nr:GDP-mannose 4,6-dehydratase [Bacteroidales bacterium]
VDLRGNTGGIFSIAQGIAGWLLPHAVSLGEMRMRDARINLTVHPRARTFSGKVAVLVDAVSLSSAEAFAAGLQDLGRARLFGQRTAGAVLASAIERLPNGDAFQYVFADYLTPAGRRLEGVGVMPDELVPLRRTSLLSGRDEIHLGALHPTRDLVFVRDTVEGLIRAGLAPDAPGREVNISTGREIAMGDLAHLLVQMIRPGTPIVVDDKRLRPELSEVDRLLGDTRLLQQLTGWQPSVSLEDGLEATVNWYRQHPDPKRFKSDAFTL